MTEPTTGRPGADPVKVSTGSGGPLLIERLSKNYGTTRALDGVSFAVQPGEFHALLGGNGSGKSTLIKILAGVVRADNGRIAVGTSGWQSATGLTPRSARELGLRFVYQDPPLFPDLSIAENLAIGSGFVTDPLGRIRWHELRRQASETLHRFEIDADPARPVSSLSPAAQTLLTIARALADDEPADRHRTLVLDEPTATLPRHEIGLLLSSLRRLAATGTTVLMVNHRLDEVSDAAQSFTVLRDGHHITTDRLAGRSTAQLAALIVGRELRTAQVPVSENVNTATLQVSGLAARGAHAVDVSVDAGEIVGLAGLGGAGCTSTLRAIAGDLRRDAGKVRLGDTDLPPGRLATARRAGIVYVPGQRSQIGFSDMSLAANISGSRVGRFWRYGRLSRSAERRAAQVVLTRYGVVAPSCDVPLSMLSGGNQQKVIVAAALDQRPRVLLLDEPTQGVDVGARRAIHGLIEAAAAEGTCVLIASSDLDELARLCHRVLVLRRGRIAQELSGDSLQHARLLACIQNDQLVAEAVSENLPEPVAGGEG